MAQSKKSTHLGQENKWLSKTIKMWYQQGKYQKNEYFLETSRPLQKIKIIEMRVDLYTKTKIINIQNKNQMSTKTSVPKNYNLMIHDKNTRK